MKTGKAAALVLCMVYLITLTLGSAGCGSKDRNGVEPDKSNTVLMRNDKSGAPEADAQAGALEQKSAADAPVIGKPEFAKEKQRGTAAVEWKPRSYESKVKPYKIDRNLSNVVNLKQFGKFGPEQMKMLEQNGFAVFPSRDEQLFYVYEDNQYKKIPSFITTDSVLQVYHIYFDYSLRTLEYEKLLGILEKLTENMLNKSIGIYGSIKNPNVKKASLKNAAYFAVAQLALGKPLPKSLPPEVKKLAEEEFKLLSSQGGFEKSEIFGFKLDYSQYTPRGHYTRNSDFRRYFKTMMWYGQVPFPMVSVKNGQISGTETTIQALLMTYTTFIKNGAGSDIELWEKIYDPTVFYVGSSDDLQLYDLSNLLVKVYGKEPDINTFDRKDKLEQLYKEVKKLPEPAIKPAYTTVDTPTGKQFRFMGQRYIPDSEIMQELVTPIKRPFPKGLDVMGVLGSERAYDLLINTYKTDKKWSEYPSRFSKLKKRFAAVTGEKWRSNMYYGWLWVLKSFTGTYGNGYPSFMRTTAWKDKSLNTALGSWAELRHDTILYAKQSGAECGGGEEEAPPVVKGYVEPNIDVYEKLLWLTKYSRTNLNQKGILPMALEEKMYGFEDMLEFLTRCSIKELRNEELTREEYDQLLVYGGLLESLTISLAGGSNWYEITSDADKNMAVIGDVHTVPGWYLEEGVGYASHIYVVVPIGGKLYLTRGAVFSYYEFESDKRLTDEEWQKLLKENKQPPQPEWTKSFTIKDKQKDIPIPVNPYTGSPYSSGC